MDFAVQVRPQLEWKFTPKEYRVWKLLSKREIQVARLVAEGKRNAEVARELGISTLTVETHLKHIYAKCGIKSRMELARAIQDLVDYPPR